MAITGDLAVWESETEGLELLPCTIGDLLDQQTKLRPKKEALVYSYPENGLDLRLNYEQYRTEVDRLSKALLALGIAKGEHVGVWATNVPEWILLQLALARIGAVMITINTAYKASELEYVLRQGDVSSLFLIEKFRENSYLDSLYHIVPELRELTDPLHQTLQSTRLPRLKRAILINGPACAGLLPYSQVAMLAASISDDDLEARKASVMPQDVAVIMYTSGTTGFPKGAMLTHFNLINTMHIITRGKDHSADRFVNPMPLFHIAGANFVLFSLMNGLTLIPLITFDASKDLELLVKEKATTTFGVPTMLMAMLNHPRFLAGEFDLSSLRLIYTGGTPIPAFLMRQVKEKMHANCKIFFGQTELAAAGTMTLDEDSFELQSETVGRPYPHLEMKVINPQTGQPAGLDERGELLARSFCVMKGYYNMPEKTAEVIDADGWLHTGDLATMNPRGYIKIVGRVKEMVIRGGENVYPVEVEQFLLSHPKVAEAQVVGVPDAHMGEETAAFIRLKPGEQATADEMRNYCRANISRYKVPKYFVFVREYPLTASGKIKKFELRAQFV